MEDRKRKATSAAVHAPLLLLTRCAASYSGQMLNSHSSWMDDAVTALCSFNFVAIHEFWWSLNHLWQLSPARKDAVEGIQLNSAEMRIFCHCWQWYWLSFSSHCAAGTAQDLLQRAWLGQSWWGWDTLSEISPFHKCVLESHRVAPWKRRVSGLSGFLQKLRENQAVNFWDNQLAVNGFGMLG